MPEIVFWAALEELIKLGIVSLFKNTWFRIPSYFVFFAAECLMKWPDVYPHTLELGASPLLALLGSVSVVVGSSLFHVYTSVLYAVVRHVWPALAFCTLLHAGWNSSVDFLPRFEFFWYAAFPWAWAVFSAFLIYGYWRLVRRIHVGQRGTSPG